MNEKMHKKNCKQCKYAFKDTTTYRCQYVLCTGRMIGHLKTKDRCPGYEKGDPVPTIDDKKVVGGDWKNV